MYENTVRMGFKQMDRILEDGLLFGNVTLIAGDSMAGKTDLAINFMRNKIKAKDVALGYITLKESAEEIVSKTICSEMSLDYRKVLRGDLLDKEMLNIEDVSERLFNSNVFVIEEQHFSIYDVMETMEYEAREHGVRMFIVDDIQHLMENDSNIGNDKKKVTIAMRCLKITARMLNVHIVVLATFRKPVMPDRPDILFKKLHLAGDDAMYDYADCCIYLVNYESHQIFRDSDGNDCHHLLKLDVFSKMDTNRYVTYLYHDAQTCLCTDMPKNVVWQDARYRKDNINLDSNYIDNGMDTWDDRFLTPF